MAATPAVIESYSRPPSVEEVRDCARKLLGSHHLAVLAVKRARRALRSRTPAKGGRARVQRAPPLPRIPVLWITSPGHPAGVIRAFALRRLRGWPSGVYTGPLDAIPMRLVLADELPAQRETLALRLMGQGVGRRRAIQELSGLPIGAWERRQIAPLLVELYKMLSQTKGRRLLTKQERELLVNGQKMIEAIENKGRKAGLRQGLQQGLERGLQQGREQGLQQGREQGLQQGREQGLQQGREQGLELLVRMVTRKLGRPPTERERATLLRRFDRLGPDRLGDAILDLDAPALAAWLTNPRAR